MAVLLVVSRGGASGLQIKPSSIRARATPQTNDKRLYVTFPSKLSLYQDRYERQEQKIQVKHSLYGPLDNTSIAALSISSLSSYGMYTYT